MSKMSVLKEICDNNDIWEFLYNKTNPLKILDTSIHIGYHTDDEHLSKEELLKKYKVIKPRYWLPISNIWSRDYKFSGCCNNCSNYLEPIFIKYKSFILDRFVIVLGLAICVLAGTIPPQR